MQKDKSLDHSEQNLRIVLVAACPFPANHGTPASIRLLAINLAEFGHQVHLVTYPQKDDSLSTKGLKIHRVFIPFIKANHIAIGPSYKRLLYDFLIIFKLIKIIRKHDIQVIHAHNYESTIAATIAKWITGKPLIYNGVNSMADELASYNFIKPRKLAYFLGRVLDYIVPRAGDIVTTVSEELKDYLQSLGIKEKKIVVIPPGVEIEMFDQGDSERIRILHDLKKAPIVMYAGALEAFQRIDYLLLAMQEVIKTQPTAKLLMVGNIRNPVAINKYTQMAKDLGIIDNIIFIETVPLDQLADYLATANVTVVPRPNCPGYPVKLLNYMAAGKAIVAFEGSAKAIFHGYNGYIAKDHDYKSLAKGILLLLKDKKLQTVLGSQAKQSLYGVYDWNTITKGTELLYRQVIDNREKLNKEAMGDFIKGSYLPQLCSTATLHKDFLQAGPIIYPSFSEIQQEL